MSLVIYSSTASKYCTDNAQGGGTALAPLIQCVQLTCQVAVA